jgi:hypothetical protein
MYQISKPISRDSNPHTVLFTTRDRAETSYMTVFPTNNPPCSHPIVPNHNIKIETVIENLKLDVGRQ